MEYFFHGTGEYLEDALTKMIEIIKSGGIKSKNKRQATQRTLYNGDDFISVSRRDEEFDYENGSMLDTSFSGWIYGTPVFIISPDIEAVHAKKVPLDYKYDPSKERVSQFVDEWHVADEIPLDKIVGIALPFQYVDQNPLLLSMIRTILEYAKVYGWKVYNSDEKLLQRIEKDEVYNMAK